jgi:hypothetical protein
MGLILAFIAGFVVGGRGGNEGVDEVVAALKAVGESQEVNDLRKALRSHAGHVLQELGRRLETEEAEPFSMGTILDRARGLIQRDATENAS